MMGDNMNWEEDDELNELLDKYENALQTGEPFFFDVDEWNLIIDYYFDDFSIDKAWEAMKYAEQVHISNPSLKLRKARLLAAHNKLEEALAVLESIDEFEDEEYLLGKAEVYSMLDFYEKSIEIYKQVLEITDHPAEVHTNIALEYENLNDYKNALKHMEAALTANPDSEEIMHEVSFFFEMADLNEEAVSFFDKFLDDHPYNKYAWFNLGLFYSNLGLYEKAIESYEFAVAIDESMSSAYFNIGNAYSQLNHFRKAIKYYKKTFEYESPDPLTYSYIAECYENIGENGEALTYYNNALDLDSRFADAWFGVGRIFAKIESPRAAVKYFEKALSLSPEDVEIAYELGISLLGAGEFSEALKYLEMVVNKERNMVAAWMNYSLAYAVDGDMGKAVEILKKGLVYNDDSGVMYFRLGGYLFNMGKIEEAYFYIEEGLRIDYNSRWELEEYIPDFLNDSRYLELLEIYKTADISGAADKNS